MSPFELSGPTFLILFGFAALGATAATLGLRWLVMRLDRRGDPAEIAARLHPTEVGFLLCDLDRAVEAAVAGLLHRGDIEIVAGLVKRTGRPNLEREISREGVFRGVAARADRAAIEAYVLSHTPATMRELCEVARDSHLAAELAGKLEEDGLLIRGAEGAAWLVRIPALAWLSFGALKLIFGIARDRSIGALLLLLGAGGWLLVRLARRPRLTSLGQAVARELRASAALEATAKTAPQQLSGPEMARAYAIFGHAVATPAALVVMPSFIAALGGSLRGGGAGGGGASGGCGASGGSGGGSGCGSSCGGGCGGCS